MKKDFLNKNYNLNLDLSEVLLNKKSCPCISPDEIVDHFYYHLSALKEGRKIKISKFCIRNLNKIPKKIVLQNSEIEQG